MPAKSSAARRSSLNAQRQSLLKKAQGRYFKHLRREFEAGDRMCILLGLQECARSRIAPPGWLADAYLAAIKIVLEEGAKSWDAAFGEPWPGVHTNGVRTYTDRAICVHEAIENRPDGCPIDISLFEAVGEHLEMSGAAVRDLWYLKNHPIEKARQLRKKSKISGITRARK